MTSFDMALAEKAPLSFDREYAEDEMWANYEYYVKALLPIAEEAGVKLALHPDDPPVASLGGVAHIFHNFEGFKRAMEIGDSPAHGLDFCHGCWSEMGPGVLDAIRFFGKRNQILYVHFRDVQGTVPNFQECFIDEGNSNPFEVIKTLKQAGFTGFLIADHVPHIVDDTPWGHRARAHALGYMKALLDTIDELD